MRARACTCPHRCIQIYWFQSLKRNCTRLIINCFFIKKHRARAVPTIPVRAAQLTFGWVVVVVVVFFPFSSSFLFNIIKYHLHYICGTMPSEKEMKNRKRKTKHIHAWVRRASCISVTVGFGMKVEARARTRTRVCLVAGSIRRCSCDQIKNLIFFSQTFFIQ